MRWCIMVMLPMGSRNSSVERVRTHINHYPHFFSLSSGNMTLWLKSRGLYDRTSTESSNAAFLSPSHSAVRCVPKQLVFFCAVLGHRTRASRTRAVKRPFHKCGVTHVGLTLLCCFDKVSANTLHTLSNGFRFGDAEASHATSMLHMRAAADLHQVIPDLVNFDQVTIAIAKEGQRSLIECLLQGHHLHGASKIMLKLPVHDLLDASDLFRGQFLRMREVKAQPFRCVVAAHLAHMRPQHITQRLVEQVRRGVQLRRAFAMVGRPARKPSLIGLTRALLVLLEEHVEAIQIRTQPMAPAPVPPSELVGSQRYRRDGKPLRPAPSFLLAGLTFPPASGIL